MRRHLDEAFLEIIENNDFEAFEQYLEKPENLEELKNYEEDFNPSSEEWMPLHYAASRGCPEIVEALIRHGSDVDCFDSQNETPLFCAINDFDPKESDRYLRVVDILIRSLANVNCISYRGTTPAHEAASSVSEDILKRLIQAGADIDRPDHDGFTPLHIAAQRGSRKNGSLLLDAGADIQKRNEEMGSALHIAAACGISDRVSVLLENGADPCSENTDGDTPLHLAVRFGHQEVVKQLAPVSETGSVNNHGFSALETAVKYERKEIAALLLDNGYTWPAKAFRHENLPEEMEAFMDAEITRRELEKLDQDNLGSLHEEKEAAPFQRMKL